MMDGRFTGYTEQSRQRTVNWLSAMSQSLDISQRAHLYSLLKGYARDFEADDRQLTSQHRMVPCVRAYLVQTGRLW